MARLVEVAIEFAGHAAIGLRRDHGGFAGGCQGLDNPLIGIKRLVADQHVGLQIPQQVIGTNQIMRLAAGQMKADRIAQRIDQGMNLGAQPAPGASDRLILADFFWAPALC